MTKLPWKPWHDVVELRDELKSGDLTLAMFAADLHEVVLQQARAVYQGSGEVFIWAIRHFRRYMRGDFD